MSNVLLQEKKTKKSALHRRDDKNKTRKITQKPMNFGSSACRCAGSGSAISYTS